MGNLCFTEAATGVPSSSASDLIKASPAQSPGSAFSTPTPPVVGSVSDVTPPPAPSSAEEKKAISVNKAKNAIEQVEKELESMKQSVAQAEKVKAKKLAKAEELKAEANKKAEEASLLEKAYEAKKACEEQAHAVKEASKKESTLKEIAERTKIAAEAAIGSDAEGEAAATAAAAEEEASRASLVTKDAIDVSISTTNSNVEASELMKKRMESLVSVEWTVARIFALFDFDGNGNLDKEEIKKAIIAISEKVPTEDQLNQAFKKYDANNDGTFQRDELEVMLGDSLLQRKRRGSAFGRTKLKDVNVDEMATVSQIKEDLAGRELVLMIKNDKDAAEANAAEAEKTLSNADKEYKETKEKEAAVESKLDRQKTVVKSIEENEWSVERVFAAFDVDKNEKLDVAELKLALTSLLEKEVSNSDATKLVKKYDVDGNGFLDFEEFSACVDTAQASLNNFFNNLFSPPSANDDVTKEAREAVAELESK